MIEDSTPFSEQNKKLDITQHLWNAAHPTPPRTEAQAIAKAVAEGVAKASIGKPIVKPLPPSWPYAESDPNGLAPHAPGAKLDAGKIRPALVLGGFAHALEAVIKVGTNGATKYSDNGWLDVEDGIDRYTEAMGRHWLRELMGEAKDPQWNLPHAAHLAWNALARLELMLRASSASEACSTGTRTPPHVESGQ